MAKTISLVPQQLTKKHTATVKKKTPLPTPIKKRKTDNILDNNYSDDSDNDDEVQNDFFSINKPVEVPVYEGSLDIDEPKEVTQNQAPRSLESYFKKDVANHVELQQDYEEYDNQPQVDVCGNVVANNYGIETSTSYSSETPTSSNNGEVVLDEEAVSIILQSSIAYKKDFVTNSCISFNNFLQVHNVEHVNSRYVNYAVPAANAGAKKSKSSM